MEASSHDATQPGIQQVTDIPNSTPPGARPERSNASFATFGLSKNLLRGVADLGFEQPRPIQAKTIPEALAGRDVLGLAQTGTGKTAAFALPILERLAAQRGKNPRALILAPTRELAMQIHAEIEQLAKYSGIRSMTVFGGVGAAPQVRALRAKPHIVVACPGRLLDLMGSGDAKLDGVEVLVLDEADHMLDMGFLPDIKRILARLPEPRQNLMFSATMPREIRSLTDRVLRNPHVVELAVTAPLETIEHALYPVEQKNKSALLRRILHGDDFESAIVFLRTKHRAKRLARDLDRVGHRAIALQGNMSQSQRQKAMQGFRDGTFDVLVATDIAARGIDVANVSHVINFDVPNTPDAYTHRIGRTGRAERNGKAYTFFTREDRSAVADIERKLSMRIPRVEVNGFASDAADEGSTWADTGRKRQGGGRNQRQSGGSSRPARTNTRTNTRTSSRTNTRATSRVTAPAPAPAATPAPAAGPSFGAGIGSGSSAPPKSGSGQSKNGRKRRRMRQDNPQGGKSFGAGVGGARRGGNRGRRGPSR